jgi:hypothetical protein
MAVPVKERNPSIFLLYHALNHANGCNQITWRDFASERNAPRRRDGAKEDAKKYEEADGAGFSYFLLRVLLRGIASSRFFITR